jgi:transposase
MASINPHTPPLCPLPGARYAHLYRIPPQRPILSLDVSKANLVATYDDRQSTRRQQLKVSNTAAGVRKLLKRTPAECCWVLEPTGRYSNLAVDQARAAGRDVLLAEPRRAKAFLQSSHVRAKNDPLDSDGLNDYAAARPLPLYPRPTPTLELTQQLLSARRGLSQSLSRLRQQRRELPQAAGVLEPACQVLEAQLQAIDAQLEALVKDPAHKQELGTVERLDAVPGIGTVTATAVNARLQRCGFSHPDQFVAYVGLDITVRDSGKKQGKREVSQRGDAELRRLLYLAAQANLRCKNSPFKDQYEREKAKGLTHTGAVCAVARKLAKVCWSLATHGGHYDPKRVANQPQRAGKAPTQPISDKIRNPLDNEP